MCQAIEEMRNDALAEGRAEGVEEGVAKGILGAIAICRDLGLSAGETLDRIVSRFSLTRDEAEAYMKQASLEA